MELPILSDEQIRETWLKLYPKYYGIPTPEHWRLSDLDKAIAKAQQKEDLRWFVDELSSIDRNSGDIRTLERNIQAFLGELKYGLAELEG